MLPAVPILRALFVLLLAAAACAPLPGNARALHARIDRIVSPVATLDGVEIDIDWPDGAKRGVMHLRTRTLDASGLGYHFTRLAWSCDMARSGWSRWTCSGPLHTASGESATLSIDLKEAGTEAVLARGSSRIAMQRRASAPDLTRVDLTAIPLAWTRVLLKQAWPQAQLKAGEGDAHFAVTSSTQGVRIAGPLNLRGVSLDTPDGHTAADKLGAAFDLDMLLGADNRVKLRGALLGGEVLFGTTYIALGGRRVGLAIDAEKQGACCWRIPHFDWRDGAILGASGSATFDADANPRDVAVDVRSADLSLARDAYLSGFLGAGGLQDLELRGGLRAHLELADGRLRAAAAMLDSVTARDPKGRFAFDSVSGDARYSATAPVRSELRWMGGSLYGLDFGAATIPLSSGDGKLAVEQAVDVPMLGGHLGFDHLSIRPGGGTVPTVAEFGLRLDSIDVAQLAKALKLPAFTGQLSGRIPGARYSSDVLTFDGGLSMQVFGGQLQMSGLSMERPFGVAPTLSADVTFDDLDLESLTGVLGFGSITGLLDGRLTGLRLVDWQPVAFDAHLRTDRHRGVRQRISQRAVQDLSSVGDSSIASSLQSRLIGLFNDFGYSRIGIDCRLADQVCDMSGLGSAGRGFTIVSGSGIPRLTVVGFNHKVDWPTLVERLVAVGKGETKAIVK